MISIKINKSDKDISNCSLNLFFINIIFLIIYFSLLNKSISIEGKMLQLYQVAYGLFIALVLFVVAILSMAGAVGAAYAHVAWLYFWAFLLGVVYVGFRFMFGDQPFDWSQGAWNGFVKVTSKSLGGE